MSKRIALIVVAALFPQYSQADEVSARLAADAQSCVQRPDEGQAVSVPVRVVLADDGSVRLIEVTGRNGDQALYDAHSAAMRAVQTCAPYEVGRGGEFEIMLTY